MRSCVGTRGVRVTPIEIVSDSDGWIELQLCCATPAAASRTRHAPPRRPFPRAAPRILAAEARDEVGVAHLPAEIFAVARRAASPTACEKRSLTALK
jgi:hypothetical protein